jgi:hypothetical protein
MKIAMYDLEGHLLEVFQVERVVNLEKQLDIPQGSLNNCLNGSALTTINMQFREVKGKKRIINKIGDVSNCTQHHAKPVHKYYKGVYIYSYDSATIASVKNRVEVANINRCCNHEVNTAGGFEWKYAI